MSLPTPHPGLVIRHSYLWHRERTQGRDSGAKDRPAAVLVATALAEGQAVRVYLLPITHTAPGKDDAAIEIPQAIKGMLKLDGERSWIVIDEINDFIWPGFDLAPVPGSDPPRFDYGVLPPTFFRKVRDAVTQLYREKRLKVVKRD